MKRTFLSLSLLLSATILIFASCNKERTCTCEWESDLPAPNPPYASGADPIPLGKMSKSAAEDSCNSIQATYDANPYYTSSACEL